MSCGEADKRGGSEMNCIECDWFKGLEDSKGQTIYFCMNASSPAYCEITGFCGYCDADEEEKAGGEEKWDC